MAKKPSPRQASRTRSPNQRRRTEKTDRQPRANGAVDLRESKKVDQTHKAKVVPKAGYVVASYREGYAKPPWTGEPPNSLVRPGTKVSILQSAGSYSLIQISRSGEFDEVWIATQALRENKRDPSLEPVEKPDSASSAQRKDGV